MLSESDVLYLFTFLLDDHYPTHTRELSDQTFPYTPVSRDPFASEEDAIRHEDGGPVVQLVRSESGRLPPAYHSWNRAPAAAPLLKASEAVSSSAGYYGESSDNHHTMTHRPLPVPANNEDHGRAARSAPEEWERSEKA